MITGTWGCKIAPVTTFEGYYKHSAINLAGHLTDFFIIIILESKISIFLTLTTLNFPPIIWHQCSTHTRARGAHMHTIQHYGQLRTRRTFEQHLIPHISHQIRKLWIPRWCTAVVSSIPDSWISLGKCPLDTEGWRGEHYPVTGRLIESPSEENHVSAKM